MKDRHKNIPAVYLALCDEGKVLLLKRKNTGYEDGNYSLVAGHLEPSENVRQCIVREAYEEAGISLDPSDLEFAHIMHRRVDDSSLERIDIFFITSKWAGVIVNNESNKCEHLKWFEIGNLPQNTIPYIKKALEAIGNREPYGEFGWK